MFEQVLTGSHCLRGFDSHLFTKLLEDGGIFSDECQVGCFFLNAIPYPAAQDYRAR